MTSLTITLEKEKYDVADRIGNPNITVGGANGSKPSKFIIERPKPSINLEVTPPTKPAIIKPPPKQNIQVQLANQPDQTINQFLSIKLSAPQKPKHREIETVRSSTGLVIHIEPSGSGSISRPHRSDGPIRVQTTNGEVHSLPQRSFSAPLDQLQLSDSDDSIMTPRKANKVVNRPRIEKRPRAKIPDQKLPNSNSQDPSPLQQSQPQENLPYDPNDEVSRYNYTVSLIAKGLYDTTIPLDYFQRVYDYLRQNSEKLHQTQNVVDPEAATKLSKSEKRYVVEDTGQAVSKTQYNFGPCEPPIDIAEDRPLTMPDPYSYAEPAPPSPKRNGRRYNDDRKTQSYDRRDYYEQRRQPQPPPQQQRAGQAFQKFKEKQEQFAIQQQHNQPPRSQSTPIPHANIEQFIQTIQNDKYDDTIQDYFELEKILPNAVPASVYDIDRLREIGSSLDKKIKIGTNGYIMYLTLFAPEQKRPKTPSGRGSSKTKPGVAFVEHTDRFIPSSTKKSVYAFDETTLANRVLQTRKDLNRLTTKNLREIQKSIEEKEIGFELLISLLLERSTTPIEVPEKNESIKLFTMYAFMMADDSTEFRDKLRELSMAKLNEMITQKVDVLLLQNIMVWISSLAAEGILTLDEYVDVMRSIPSNFSEQITSSVYRSSLFVSGPSLEQREPLLSEFFNYLSSNMPTSGYERFMISDLLKLRDNHWIENSIQSATTTTTTAVAANTDARTAADLEDQLLNQFSLQASYFTYKVVSLPMMMTSLFKLIPRNVVDLVSWSQWMIKCIKQISSSQRDILKALPLAQAAFSEAIADSEVPHPYTMLATCYGELIAAKLITLQTAVFQLKDLDDVSFVLEQLGVYPIKQIEALGSKEENNDIIAGLITMIDFDVDPTPSNKNTKFSHGIEICQTIWEMFGDSDYTFEELVPQLGEVKETFFSKFERDLVCKVVESTMLMLGLQKKIIREVVDFLAQ